MTGRITATFSIWSNISPEEITSILGVSPDRTVIRGMDRTPPRNVPTAHGWHMTSVVSDDVPIESVIWAVLAKMPNLKEKIEKVILADETAKTSLSLAIRSKSKNVPLLFPKDIVSAISAAQSSIDVDFFEDDE